MSKKFETSKSNNRFRSHRDLARKKPTRKPRHRILIVCEGESERHYFEEFRQFHKKIITAAVEVSQSKGTSPQQVIAFARNKLTGKQSTRRWEKIFCVFDADQDIELKKLLEEAEAINKKYKNDFNKAVEFKIITSAPCFELWILLHFQYTTRPMNCQEVNTELHKHFRYKKAEAGLVARIHDKLKLALQYANKLTDEQKHTNSQNPLTEVGDLINQLLPSQVDTAIV